MSQATTLTDVALRAVGRAPAWVEQAAAVAAPNGVPVGAAAGVDVENAVQALISAVVASGTAITWRVWLLPDGTGAAGLGDPPTDWMLANGVEFTVTESTVERINVAGFKRVYIEVVATAGAADLWVAPCRTEE